MSLHDQVPDDVSGPPGCVSALFERGDIDMAIMCSPNVVDLAPSSVDVIAAPVPVVRLPASSRRRRGLSPTDGVRVGCVCVCVRVLVVLGNHN